jgi:hypothetical protein
MSEKVELSEESLRRIAAQKVTFRYSVRIHAVIYVLVNIALFVINYLFTPFFWWALIPLFGWLIGVVIHGIAYVLYARGTSYGVRGVMFHLAAWAFGMLLLVVINYITSVPVGKLDWVIYPAIFWSIGLIVHILVQVLFFGKGSTEKTEKPSKKEQAIEKEMQKMRERVKNQ